MLKTNLDSKILMAESFLNTAKLIEQIGVPEIESISNFRELGYDSPKDFQEKCIESQRRLKISTHFLYAMVFELSIKIIWEIEQGKEAPYHHNIHCLYEQLSDVANQQISNMYDIQYSNTEKRIQELISRPNGYVLQGLELQSLEDALKSNEKIVKDFKYDGEFNGKSSVLGSIIWKDDTYWILPPSISNITVSFPKDLLNYAVSIRHSKK